jgi:TusA-related sulfurtransferase
VKPTPAPSTSAATRSVPSSPDLQPRRPDRPILVGNSCDSVGFLDALGVDAEALFDAIDCVLAGMSDGAILTVYTDDPAAAAAAGEWCAGHGVELLAIIRHGHHGTTLTVRRADPPA